MPGTRVRPAADPSVDTCVGHPRLYTPARRKDVDGRGIRAFTPVFDGLCPAMTKLEMSVQKHEGERIAKVIARAGLASRREAEAWIAAGRVAVNGAVIRSPAVSVTAHDGITVDGKALPRRERTRLFLFHKPRGVLTSHGDPRGRP